MPVGDGNCHIPPNTPSAWKRGSTAAKNGATNPPETDAEHADALGIQLGPAVDGVDDGVRRGFQHVTASQGDTAHPCLAAARRFDGQHRKPALEQPALDHLDGLLERVKALHEHHDRQLLPMALATVVEETPGVHRFQIVQTAPTTLTVRLQTEPGASREQVWATVRARLADHLAGQGLSTVTLELAAEAPMPSPRGGKLRHVLAQLAVQRPQPTPALGRSRAEGRLAVGPMRSGEQRLLNAVQRPQVRPGGGPRLERRPGGGVGVNRIGRPPGGGVLPGTMTHPLFYEEFQDALNAAHYRRRSSG